MGTGNKASFITGLSDVDSVDREGIGTIRWEGNKCYKYVLYNDGTDNLDVVAGDFVVYLAATGYELSTVVPDASDGDATTPFGAGVIVATNTNDARYVWIQIKGSVTLSLDPTGPPSDSNAIVPSATNKAVAVATSSDVEHICGHVIDDTEKLVYLDCPY